MHERIDVAAILHLCQGGDPGSKVGRAVTGKLLGAVGIAARRRRRSSCRPQISIAFSTDSLRACRWYGANAMPSRGDWFMSTNALKESNESSNALPWFSMAR